MLEFQILKTDPPMPERGYAGSHARRGTLTLNHGVVQTPIFMPVGTYGTVKGVMPRSLHEMGAQIILGNTFHLWMRPGQDIIRQFDECTPCDVKGHITTEAEARISMGLSLRWAARCQTEFERLANPNALFGIVLLARAGADARRTNRSHARRSAGGLNRPIKRRSGPCKP